MKKHIKNLKVCWVPLLAIAVAASIVSCHNEKMSEKAKKAQQEIFQSNFSSLEESFQKSRSILDNFEFVDDQIIERDGFSK